MSRRGARWARADALASRQQAGVGDRADVCEHGTEGCPDENGLPCFECLLDQPDGDREVATDGGTQRPSDVRRSIREYLERRLEAGNRYVKVHQITAATGISSHRIAGNIPEVREHGWLEIWSEGSNGNTYRITIDEDGGDRA